MTGYIVLAGVGWFLAVKFFMDMRKLESKEINIKLDTPAPISVIRTDNSIDIHVQNGVQP
jgi:hypothetical protein